MSLVIPKPKSNPKPEKKQLGTMIRADLDREIELLATKADMTKQSVVEAALQLLVHVAKWGIPDDLGLLLQQRDPELLERLARLRKAAG